MSFAIDDPSRDPSRELSVKTEQAELLGPRLRVTNQFEEKESSKKNKMRQGIRNLYGRHYAIQLKNDFKFKEQWQEKSIEFDQSNYYQLIQAETIPAYLYTAIILGANLASFWYLSVQRLNHISYQIDGSIIFLIQLALLGVDAVVKFYLEYVRHSQLAQMQIKEVANKFKGPCFLVFYYLLNLVLITENKETQWVLYLLDSVALYLVFKRTKQLFYLFKIRSYTTLYKHKMKLVDLLGTLLFFLHIFAILLFLVSFYDPTRNWTHKISDGEPLGLQRYFYAFYYAATTMLTIGYGDISPTNKMQILAILPVQILGVAVFSYIISEIGYTVSSVRKEEEQLEYNLSTLSKMSQFYHMENDLSHIAKYNLISNKKSFETVYPQAENAVLGKLSDDLRQTVTFYNGLDIVKSSIFFICHWSKHFQSEIAKNLIKKILHPNEMVVQLPGKEKIYIVRNGKLEVYTNCSANYKQQFKRLLKVISPKSDQTVTDNVYGYTSVISGRSVRLNAVSKDFSSVYCIDKQKFLSCVSESELDRQYYFEIRSKIDESKCLEGWQTPAVLNIRYHYRPSQFYIVKCHQQRLGKFKNQRGFKKRSNRKKPLRAIYQTIKLNKILMTGKLRDETHGTEQKQVLNEKSEIFSQETLEDKSIIVEMFQSAKEYHNFFRRSNLWVILSKFERENPQLQKRSDPALPRLYSYAHPIHQEDN